MCSTLPGKNDLAQEKPQQAVAATEGKGNVFTKLNLKKQWVCLTEGNLHVYSSLSGSLRAVIDIRQMRLSLDADKKSITFVFRAPNVPEVTYSPYEAKDYLNWTVAFLTYCHVVSVNSRIPSTVVPKTQDSGNRKKALFVDKNAEFVHQLTADLLEFRRQILLVRSDKQKPVKK